MIQGISSNLSLNNNFAFKRKANVGTSEISQVVSIPIAAPISKQQGINRINTTLTEVDRQKYVYLLSLLKDIRPSLNSEKVPPTKQLDILLKNGKLLQKTTHDNSSTLDNLYSMATTKRAYGMDNINLVTNTLDLLVNPRCVTQTFGDIPQDVQEDIVSHLPNGDPVKSNPDSMNVYASGTCAAASIEVNMADKYPAEFARWVSRLSSEDESLKLNVNLKSISKNPLEALEILNLLEAKTGKFNYNKVSVNVEADLNTFIRAYVQGKHWDMGERNVADVLIQSAIMKLGSQDTYNALTDIRAGKFSSNPQGLIELEKTFVESLIKDKEITSLVYQQIDENQNLVGYNCSFDKIKKHIIDTLKSGDDVILGYVLTNETAGVTKSPNYQPNIDGKPNRVINGHEITVVDYYNTDDGKTIFVCVDTDDNSQELVQYDADWLLPKVHHAGYPTHLVQQDEQEIMKNMI